MDPSKTNISHSPHFDTLQADLIREKSRISSVQPEQNIDRSAPKTKGKSHHYRRIIKSSSVSQAKYHHYQRQLMTSGVTLQQPDALSRAYFSDETANKTCFNKWLKQQTSEINDWEVLAELLTQLDDIAEQDAVPHNSLTIKQAQKIVTRKMAENIHQIYKQAKKLNHQIKREHQQYNRAGEIYSVFSEIHEISERCQRLDPDLKSKVLYRNKDRVGLRRAAFSLAKKSIKNEWTFDFQKQRHNDYMNAVLENVIKSFSKKVKYRLKKLKTFHAAHARDNAKIKPVKMQKNRFSTINERHVETATEAKPFGGKNRESKEHKKSPKLSPKNPIASKRKNQVPLTPSPTQRKKTNLKDTVTKGKSQQQRKTPNQTRQAEQVLQKYTPEQNETHHAESRPQEYDEIQRIRETLLTLGIEPSDVEFIVAIAEDIDTPQEQSGAPRSEAEQPTENTIYRLKSAVVSSESHARKVIIARILALLSFHSITNPGSKGIMINTSNNNSQGGKGGQGQGQGQDQGGNQDSSQDDGQEQQQKRQKHEKLTKKKQKKK